MGHLVQYSLILNYENWIPHHSPAKVHQATKKDSAESEGQANYCPYARPIKVCRGNQ